MLRKIGQSSSTSSPSSVNAELESDLKKSRVHQNVSLKTQEATVQSDKDLVALNGELRRTQLEKSLSETGKQRLINRESMSHAVIDSSDEANAIAKARLNELSLNYTTGEPQVTGQPKLKSDIDVEVKIKND